MVPAWVFNDVAVNYHLKAGPWLEDKRPRWLTHMALAGASASLLSHRAA